MGHASIVSRETPLPRPCTWVGRFISSKVSSSLTLDLWSHVHSPQANPTSQTLHLGSYVQSLQVDLSQPWTWGHISTVSRVTLLPRPCTCGHRSTASRLTPPPIPYTWIYTSTVSMVTSSQAMYLGSHVHSPQGLPLPDPVTGVTHPQSPQ